MQVILLARSLIKGKDLLSVGAYSMHLINLEVSPMYTEVCAYACLNNIAQLLQLLQYKSMAYKL